MGKRNCTHVQALIPEIKGMLAAGKTQREVAEYFDILIFHAKLLKLPYTSPSLRRVPPRRI